MCFEVNTLAVCFAVSVCTSGKGKSIRCIMCSVVFKLVFALPLALLQNLRGSLGVKNQTYIYVALPLTE